MKTNLDRIISVTTLLTALLAIVVVMKKPAPVAAPPQAPAPTVIAEPAQPSNPTAVSPQPTEQPFSSGTVYRTTAPRSAAVAPQPAAQPSNAKADPRINSEEVSAAVAKMLGSSAGTPALTPDSNVGSGEPVIKDQQITMDGDIVHGKFLTSIAGKDVWITMSGHMGEKDGYATFDPTEFKVGDMNVPVSLVNPALQRKLAEERDRLKIPNN